MHFLSNLAHRIKTKQLQISLPTSTVPSPVHVCVSGGVSIHPGLPQALSSTGFCHGEQDLHEPSEKKGNVYKI